MSFANTQVQRFVGRDDHTLVSRVDALLQRALVEERIVGAVVMIARDGRVVYERAAGLADRELTRPMSLDTVFRMASLTKPIVSVAALSLIERGVLGLDDPVTRWLPHFRPVLRNGREPTITVRHLLTHTSGLGYGFTDEESQSYRRARVSSGLDQPGLSFHENARRLISAPLFAEPGTEFRYSLSTDVLGEVMASAAGTTLPELVSGAVTEPLGMVDSSFRVADPARLAVPYADGHPRPVRMTADHAVPFAGGSVRFAPARSLHPESYPSGGSGIVGTAADFLRFAEAIRRSDRRLLGPAVFDAMKRDQVAGRERPTAIPGDGWGFGFGVAVLLDPVAAATPMSAGSWRWEGAYGHSFTIDPTRRLTVVALTNTTFEGMFGALPSELTRAALEAFAGGEGSGPAGRTPA